MITKSSCFLHGGYEGECAQCISMREAARVKRRDDAIASAVAAKERLQATMTAAFSNEREALEKLVEEWLMGPFLRAETRDAEVAVTADLIQRERADAVENAPSCKCESLIGQIKRSGKAFESSCPVHEWRLVDLVMSARENLDDLRKRDEEWKRVARALLELEPGISRKLSVQAERLLGAKDHELTDEGRAARDTLRDLAALLEASCTA